MKSHHSNPDALREKVRAGFSQIALHGSERRKSSCCGGLTAVDSKQLARQIGYSAGELAGLPEGANIGLSYGVGHCSVIVLAGTFTEVVQRFLNWNEQSKGVTVIKCVCGVLVLLGGVWLIYSAP